MKNKENLWQINEKQKNRWKAMKNWTITIFQGPTAQRSLHNRSLKTLKNIE